MNGALRELPVLQPACAGQITAIHFEVDTDSGSPGCPGRNSPAHAEQVDAIREIGTGIGGAAGGAAGHAGGRSGAECEI